MERRDGMGESALREPSARVDARASQVIDAALEVHRTLGPGFLESVYEHAMCVELALRGVPFERHARVAVRYKGRDVGEGTLDLLVDGELVVELKAVERLARIHWVQVRSYLKATGHSVALLINFNVPLLRDGIRRIVLTADPAPQQGLKRQEA